MTESQLRRLARKHGYRFYRSNWRKDTIENCRGYQLLDTSTNLVIDGVKYDCTLEDIEDRLRYILGEIEPAFRLAAA